MEPDPPTFGLFPPLGLAVLVKKAKGFSTLLCDTISQGLDLAPPPPEAKSIILKTDAKTQGLPVRQRF